MRRWWPLLAGAVILLASFITSHSTSGFLLIGGGLILLLDRYAVRRLPWPPLVWRNELILRAGGFLLGVVAFWLMRPGVVPIWEAAYRGLAVTLAVFLFGAVLGLARRRRTQLWLGGVLGAVFVLLIPVIAALHPLHTVPKRTPAAFGLAFEDVRFRSGDGVELAAWVIPHAQDRGNVIFCHGHGRNRGHVAGLLPILHDLGMNVLAFDFRGHGDSSGETSTFGHREVQDLLAAEAYLSRRFPDRPVFLIGISLGAAVSLQALPRLPHVRGVWSEGAFARLDDVVDHYFRWVPTVLREPQVRLYEGLGWLDCGFWTSSVNPVDCLGRCQTPVFFCHAVNDELVPLKHGMALYASSPGPRECWWVQGATHYNVRQRNPEEYRRRLRAFLERCLSGAEPSPEVPGSLGLRCGGS